MSTKKLSINKVCIVLGVILLSALIAFIVIIYNLTDNFSAVFCCIMFYGFAVLCVAFFIAMVRNKLTPFSNLLCRTIDDMLSGNSKLNDYLDNTLGEIENISKCCYDVGNEIVNTVLNYYLKPIDDCCDVEVTGYISNNIPIEERDLCTVCSNLVKNPVKAVYNNEKGTIILEFDQGNNYVSITAKNTYDGKLAMDKNGELITRKNDKRNHGIGIHNIKEVVKRYEGDYETDIDENMYSANVRLKIK